MKAGRILVVILVIAVVVLAALLGRQREEPVDLETERAAIRQLDSDWQQAAAAKDLERTVSFWAEDALLFPPGTALLRGRQAIRGYVAQAFSDPNFALRWEIDKIEIAGAGDLAYTVGTNELTFTDPDGNVVTQPGKGVTVWEKQPDGAWKCVVDIWNANAPAKLD